MDKIKISICMPTHNRAGFIGTALESVISQADDSVEIVVVDGASTDNTSDVVQKYQQRFKNLIYCRQETNSGIDRDMAKAITRARGKYCWVLSDDDALKPGAIKRILKEISLGYEIYLCNVIVCNLLLRPIRERFWLSKDVGDRVFNLHYKNELIEYCNKANSIGALFSFCSSIILRRELWIKLGYDYNFDNSAYALAATLFASLGKSCRLKYIKDSLVLWRNDNESVGNAGGLAKRFLLDFDGYLKLADKYLPVDRDVRNSFLKVMRREHPWYTIIHAVSCIDSPEVSKQFKARLSEFGYNRIMIKICYALGRYKNLVSFGVKIKRKIVRSSALRMIPIFNYLLVFNIFAGAFTLFRQPFEFYLGYVFILIFLIAYVIRYRSLCFNTNFLIILAILTASSFINLYLGNVTLFLMTKQVFGILITGTAYYLLVKVNDFEIDKLFKIYLRIALVVAAIGIFQEFSYLVKFKIGYDYRWMWMTSKWGYWVAEKAKLLRVNSIFMEPSHFAISMAPAFFVSFLDIFKKNSISLKSKWGSIIIIASYILTFSLVAYVAILISILIVACLRGLRYLILALMTMPILAFSAYIFIPDIHMRINDSIAFVNHPTVNPDLHMSIYAIASNAFIAFSSFINSFMFGLGLGSHPVSYGKFFDLGVSKGLLQHNYVEVCRGDAGSLFLRLLSETGLFGIIAVFYFIFRFHLKIDNNSSPHIISNAIFILFILQLFRQGHYFYNGLFFFVWIYYFAYYISNSKISELKNH